jgi:hypothetical protein
MILKEKENLKREKKLKLIDFKEKMMKSLKRMRDLRKR